jgi:hypothetical protein
MPFNDPNNVSENPYADEAHFKDASATALVAANEDLIYDADWENPDSIAQAQGAGAPLTIIDHSGGYATIRLNQTLYYSGSIWFRGRFPEASRRGPHCGVATKTTTVYPTCTRGWLARERYTSTVKQ